MRVLKSIGYAILAILFLLAVGLVMSGCTMSATLQGTMLRGAVKVTQSVDESSDQPSVIQSLLPAPSDDVRPAPKPTVVIVRESDQVKIGDVCYASQRVKMDGKYRDVLYPVVCRKE